MKFEEYLGEVSQQERHGYGSDSADVMCLPCTSCFIFINLFTTYESLVMWYCRPVFQDEKTEGQQGEVTYPRYSL